MSSIYQKEFQSRTHRTGMLSVALAMVTALQAVTMFFALRDLLNGSGAESYAIPIGAGIVIGVAFWIAWHWLGKVGPLSHNPANRTMFVGIAAALTLVAICTTSWFVASAIGGSRAMQAHMQHYMAKANSQLEVLTVNAAAEQELTTTISDISTAWRVLADAEARGNVSAHGKGCGRQCDMYKRSASAFDALQNSVNGRFSEFNTAKDRAIEILTAMSKLASNDSTPAGQGIFARLAAELSQQYAKMNAMTALPLVGQSGIIEAERNNGVTTVRNEELTKKLQDRAAKIKAERKPLEQLSYNTTSKAPATLDHAYAVPGAWLVGVAFDLLPFIMFLMMMLAYSEARTPYQPMPEFAPIGGREVDEGGNRSLRMVA